MVFGVAGACRAEELQHVKIDHVKDCGTEIIVTAPRNRKTVPEMFLISGAFAKIVQQYMYRRPTKTTTDRFFVQYSQGECENQVIGRNKLAIVPKEIAKFLKLDDYKSYTGHSFQPPNGNRRKRFNWKDAKLVEAKLHGLESEVLSPERPKQRATATKPSNVSNQVTEARTMTRSAIANLNVMESVIIKSEYEEMESPVITPADVDVLSELTTTSNQYHPTEVNRKPSMLRATMSLMKRKSKYYMGLQSNQFLHLLQMAGNRKLTMISDVKLMLTLRKLRLNEDIEVLADAFDLDRTTAEKYYNESKHAVIDVADEVSTTVVPNRTITTNVAPAPPTSNHFNGLAEPIIKIEKCESVNAADPIAVETSDDSTNYEMNFDDQNDNFEITLPPTEEEKGFLSHDLHRRTAECTICHKFFVPRLLNTHMDSFHFNLSNLNRTFCGLCWKECETKVSLKAHQKNAHGGGSHGCDICGKFFRSKRYIEVHILTKHARVKTYLCDTCGDGFPTPYLLLDHNKKKHNEPGHACHLCPMKFMTAMWLKDHIVARHTTERPYKCLVKGCGKTFSWPSSFKSHARVHVRDKFECSVCLKRFSFKANLRNHLKIIHNQIVDNKCLTSSFV